jgi:hypothetical protein
MGLSWIKHVERRYDELGGEPCGSGKNEPSTVPYL